MGEDSVETGVDDLIRYLKGKGKLSIKEVAKAIHVSEKTLQLWVDFLVEERVLGLEYKFMNPYIFLNEEEKEKKKEAKEITLDTFRNKFFDNARKKKIPETQIQDLWERHLRTHLEHLKSFFILEAKKQNFKDADPEELYNNYITRILTPKEELKEIKEEEREELKEIKKGNNEKLMGSNKESIKVLKENSNELKGANSNFNKLSKESSSSSGTKKGVNEEINKRMPNKNLDSGVVSRES